jgi:hypothetical protein
MCEFYALQFVLRITLHSGINMFSGRRMLTVAPIDFLLLCAVLACNLFSIGGVLKVNVFKIASITRSDSTRNLFHM